MIKTKVIGRLPQNYGDFDPHKQGGYGKKQRCFLYACEWESKMEGNTYAPATLDTTTGVITPDTAHWKHCSGSYNDWLIDNGYKKVDAGNVKDGNSTQHEINAALAQSIADETQRAQEAENNRYTKSEVYTKEEVNGMITTPDQEFVTVTADNTWSAVDLNTLIDTAAGSDKQKSDTVYRVGNWDGSQFDDTVYSEYAWNGTDYVHLSTKTQIGEVFDISAYHATGGTLQTYTDLADALTGTNGGVPSTLQKGGMSIKFVQTSDNTYVQFRLMKNQWSTTPSDWQGVDKNPTPDSKSLIESGGVYKSLSYKEKIEFERSVVKRIDTNGDLINTTAPAFAVKMTLVDDETGFIDIIRDNIPSDGVCKMYAFYSTDDFDAVSSSNCVEVSNLDITSPGSKIEITIPNGAKIFAVGCRPVKNYDPVCYNVKMEDINSVHGQLALLNGYKLALIEPTEKVTGKYIASHGDIGGNGSSVSNLLSYSVEAGGKITVKRSKLATTGSGMLVWAVYNSTDKANWDSSTCVAYAADSIMSGNLEMEITIPQGGKCLVLGEVPSDDYEVSAYAPYPVSVTNARINTIEDDIDEIEAKLATLDGYKPTLIDPTEKITGKYLNGSGGIGGNGSSISNLLSYSVEEGERIKIKRNKLATTGGGMYVWAIYNSTDNTTWEASTCVAYATYTIMSGALEIEITIPQGGKCLVLGEVPSNNYSASAYAYTPVSVTNTRINNIEDEIAEIETKLPPQLERSKMMVELSSDGENLFAASNNNHLEYVYWFKKCMNNDLYTFYRVGYRVVDRKVPSTENITTDSNIVIINQTDSDNISPVKWVNGGFAGGNHLWNENYGADSVKTAKTNSYNIYADGEKLVAGEKTLCKALEIVVENTIYDPSETPVEGQTILTIPASIETVKYVVQNNTIFVTAQQKIVSTTNTLERWSGMQSVFGGSGTQFITPKGQFTDWTNYPDSATFFIKGNYPDFNRFIQKKSNCYQCAYLIPNKLGTHYKLSNSDNIFVANVGKMYHQQVAAGGFTEPTPGLSLAWSGAYIFFKDAILDDSNAFAYYGIVNRKETIFINTKGACDINIEMPAKFVGKRMVQIEKDDTISTTNQFIDSEGVSITASGIGSYIFYLE